MPVVLHVDVFLDFFDVFVGKGVQNPLLLCHLDTPPPNPFLTKFVKNIAFLFVLENQLSPRTLIPEISIPKRWWS